MSNENCELFKQALSEAMDLKNCEIEDEIKDIEMPTVSKRYKLKMNRLFLERTDGLFIPFPEEDVRSKHK